MAGVAGVAGGGGDGSGGGGGGGGGCFGGPGAPGGGFTLRQADDDSEGLLFLKAPRFASNFTNVA